MSSYSEGQTHQLMNSFESNGWTSDELRQLGQSSQHAEFRGVLRGTHEIRPIEHTVDLSIPCKLPFDNAKNVSPAKSEVVRIERRGDDLYLDGKKINLFLSKKQKSGSIVGHDLRKELERRGGNVSAKVLDYLVEHPELWPESWKKDEQGNTVYIFFWDDIFRRPSDSPLFVRCGYWHGGRVVSSYFWLDGVWHRRRPAASVAS